MTNSPNYKPEGYNSLSPYLIVKDANQTANMLEQIFDATTTRRYDRPDGTIMHAEMKMDDSIIMISQANEQFPPNQSLLHVYVPDVHAAFQKAIAYGCESVKAPVQEEGDTDIRGMFKDSDENVWAVGMQVNS